MQNQRAADLQALQDQLSGVNENVQAVVGALAAAREDLES